jgi:tetratricopeptide (TPR) repeat protein
VARFLRGGGETEGEFDRAIEELSRTASMAPGQAEIYRDRGAARLNLAMTRSSRGADSGPLLREAVADFEDALRRHRQDVETWARLAAAHACLADSRRDPLAALDEAEAACVRGLELAPGSAELHEARGAVRVRRGLRLVAMGRSPAKAIEGRSRTSRRGRRPTGKRGGGGAGRASRSAWTS